MLSSGPFAADMKSTDGIDISSWKYDEVEFCTWDFAGQTVYPVSFAGGHIIVDMGKIL